VKWVFVGLVVLVLGMGVVFIFGVDGGVDGGTGFLKESSGEDVGGEDVGVLGGGSDNVVGVEEKVLNESEVGVECDVEPVQYSLKNFVEDVECLDGVDADCLEVRMNCSVEIYNFDEGLDDLFVVDFNLVDSEEVILKSDFVEMSVGVGASEVLVSEFVEVGNFNIGDLECGIEMIDIPEKCV